MPETLDYSEAEPRSRPWLTTMFIIAGGCAALPIGIGLLCLFYALCIGMEGADEALRAGLFLVGASGAWVVGLAWLYRKVVRPVSHLRGGRSETADDTDN